MSIEKTEALVIRSVDFSESSLVLTLFTRKFGRISGLAKGARRLKNPFETSLDLLASIKLCFIKKNADALDLLTEAKLTRRFRPNSRNLRGLYAGYYVAELLYLATEDYEPIPDLWTLADSTLDAFGRRPRVGARLLAFESSLLEYLGVFPSLRHCVECGEELPLDEAKNLGRAIWFEFAAGGVVCARCRERKRFPGLGPTTIGALKTLDASLAASRELIALDATFRATLEKLDAIASERKIRATEYDVLLDEARKTRDARDDGVLAPYDRFPLATRGEARSLVERYLANYLRRRPKMFDYLNYVTRDPEPTPEALAIGSR